MHAPRTNWLAVALAVAGAASGIPLGLAQLDFAGAVDVFEITTDAPAALSVAAGVGGALTLGVVALALGGALLAAARHHAARTVLGVAAVLGFATALLPWLPSAVALGAAACLLEGGAEPLRHRPSRGGRT